MKKIFALLVLTVCTLISQASIAQILNIGGGNGNGNIIIGPQPPVNIFKPSKNIFVAHLSGAQSVTNPAGGVNTNLRGYALIAFDKPLSKMRINIRLSNASDITGIHLHCGAAGVNGPLAAGLISPGPLRLQGRFVRGELTNAHVQGSGCEEVIGRPINNLASLAYAIREGLVYVNVHTNTNPAGEIRGQLDFK